MGFPCADPSVRRARWLQAAFLAFGLLEVRCHAEARPPRTDVVDPKAKPRPPGIAVDPVFALPSPRPVASTERGVMVLLTPADTVGARELIRHFFESVVREDYAELASLFADQAVVVTDKAGRRVPAAGFWQHRLARLDYASLRGLVVYQDRHLETYRAEDVSRLGRARQLGVRNADLMVRVPVQTPRVGRVRLLGEEIWFVLRPGPNGYRIAQMQEDYEIP